MSVNIQNRTFEFQQCVLTYDKIHKKQHQAISSPQNRNPPPKSKVNQQASIIAKDISHATDLLAKLAYLAKQKPLFDDKPVEINELTVIIKQEIFKIEQNMQNLRKYILGESSSANIDKQISKNSNNILNLLSSKMKNVSGEFKNVLEIRQQNELINKQRTENFLSSSTSASNRNGSKSPLYEVLNNENSLNMHNNSSLSSLGENPYLAAANSYNPALDRNRGGGSGGADPYGDGEYLSIPNQTQQMLLMEEQNQQYLQQRGRAVETIESTINEVGNLFQQLATMVSEQGETIQRIDQNVDDINMNISGAQRELLKYYTNISNSRWLFLKIFGVLIVFFLLWVMVS
ncbi:cis-Golgi t-SNARE syntaxin [Scheffersomyces spartinae]|uniref:Cis-Golgi t-SNARE syntaxin n=1 Tax=Scheffersomyces spartinae TaxID=45513 RepID=A0A9P7VE17_9ASCO|nr:cis-Golgi t-SNARE syntaxin [Scheffersomyces spartinae]KAG7195758.1 cis-Golgi t-SNARE syntaxin [Scheffersomyces spartinae]